MSVSMVTHHQTLFELSPTDLRSIHIFLVVFALCTLFVRRVASGQWTGRARGSLPPGPVGWPLVGYAPYLGKYPHKVMANLSQTYGDVFSLAIGPRTVIVVNGVSAVKEALVTHGQDTSGRTPPARAVTVNTSLGYFWSSGDLWRAQRKFGQGVLRHLGGPGRQGLQGVIRREAAVLCAELARRCHPSAPLDTTTLVDKAVANIMCSLVFGKRFQNDDEEFQRMMELSFDIQKGGFSAVENFLPFLYKLPFLFRHAKGKKREILNFIRDMLYRDRDAVDQARAQSMADLYFIELDRQKKDAHPSPDIRFTEDNIVSAAWDMFIAGVETTAVTLAWALLYLMLHTDTQEHIQSEIDKVGGGEPPSWSDQKDMPFTRAAIMEIQRCANIVPIALPHTVTEEFQLRGHTIPKGSVLFINLWSVMSDPAEWDQPQEFRPERFLDSDLKIVKPEAFMPFSAGPRVCMGEQLAKMELFILITSVLHQFNLTLPKDEPRPCLDPLPGITCGPRPYRVCVTRRGACPSNQDRMEEL
ncbi:cytochrome P450 2D6-like [Patiria miniata]|uniref:Cytochrome P450 n=1 Tax=Patiria miniata TaxID=46514 RepID=A0A914BLC3_PATMI|nr:cytochrome P450 2D6-like [Patiria miniata]